ncbi:unnamed protein product [Nippostrongylus brasiliensis]|uniref:Uncharacterized protein n=1 Tax=Nippostrongylus brasiliensis TaxID=27835 RepID=A0A0N4Y7L6_NIPBR|nr:unnamed protein product [Nippostrongylus brasiliensis]
MYTVQAIINDSNKIDNSRSSNIHNNIRSSNIHNNSWSSDINNNGRSSPSIIYGNNNIECCSKFRNYKWWYCCHEILSGCKSAYGARQFIDGFYFIDEYNHFHTQHSSSG